MSSTTAIAIILMAGLAAAAAVSVAVAMLTPLPWWSGLLLLAALDAALLLWARARLNSAVRKSAARNNSAKGAPPQSA